MLAMYIFVQNSGLSKGKSQSKLRKGKFGKPKSNLNIVKRSKSSRNFLFGTEQLICQTNPEKWLAGVWDGAKLGWIPTDKQTSQSYPNIPMIRSTHERYCFFWYTQYFNNISFDAIYRYIFTIFSQCKLGQNALKFHSWSAYVEIFATKWPIYGIFIRGHP